MSVVYSTDLAMQMVLEAFRWGWAIRSVDGRHPMALFLKWLGFHAFTAPNKVIYVLREHEDNEVLLAHELYHVAQIRRDGRLRFFLWATFYFLWVGHRLSPIEIEARSNADYILPKFSPREFVSHVQSYMRTKAYASPR